MSSERGGEGMFVTEEVGRRADVGGGGGGRSNAKGPD